MKNQPDFIKLIDLASEKIGAKAVICSDDFFAPMENLLKKGRGIFIPDKYTDRGKWMDGWESRRKRVPGHDWCIIKLGASGIIKGFEIDTNHFLGNHPPFASVDALCSDKNLSEQILVKYDWTEILPKANLNPGSQHFFEIKNQNRWTHLRLNIYPDGGVARFRAYGEVFKNWDIVSENDLIDLAAATNGGRTLLCNDMFFSDMQNLIMPGISENMGDGWETKRSRNLENIDWVILKLGHPGVIKKIVVDTKYFKGNYPDRCSLEVCCSKDIPDYLEGNWNEILSNVKLEADKEHVFEKEIRHHEKANFAKLKIYPDGGVSRLKLFGNITKD